MLLPPCRSRQHLSVGAQLDQVLGRLGPAKSGHACQGELVCCFPFFAKWLQDISDNPNLSFMCPR